tara:strand:- start:47856 stop:48041 length:186 start_codon:yes stop_codon:yes gene_type:complete
MEKPVHEEFYGHELANLEVFEALMMDDLKPKKQTIANIMAYSKAVTFQCYESLGQQESILN